MHLLRRRQEPGDRRRDRPRAFRTSLGGSPRDMTAIADAYLAHHFAFRPVDASFMGMAGFDDRLPDASAGAADAERRGLATLRATIDATPESDDVGARLDRRLAQAQVTMAEGALEHLPRF